MAAIKVGESWFNACNSKLNLNRVDSYDSSFNRWKTRNDSNNISSITKEDVFKHLTSNSKKLTNLPTEKIPQSATLRRTLNTIRKRATRIHNKISASDTNINIEERNKAIIKSNNLKTYDKIQSLRRKAIFNNSNYFYNASVLKPCNYTPFQILKR